jgi:PAS domain S-box-containing protein
VAIAAAGRARHYARLLEHLPAGVVHLAEGRLAMNRAAEEITGYGRDDLPTLDAWFAALFGGRAREQRQLYQDDREGGFRKRRSRTLAIRRKDGSERHVEFAACRFGDAEVWLMYDATDRYHAEEALRDREDFLRSVLEMAADAIITIDAAGCIESFNPAAQRMFGYTAAEVIGQNVRLLMPPPYRDEHDGYVARYLETREARIIGFGREVVGLRKDGSTFPMDLAVSEVKPHQRFAGIIRDIGPRVALERRLAERSDEERASLARELHDEMGGAVTGIGVMAQALESKLQKEGSPLARRAGELVKGITGLHTKLRALTSGLMPVEELPEGLMVALRGLAEDCARTRGSRCRIVCDPPVLLDDVTVATHLFRIAQEAVSNALRHGKAKHINIELTRDRDALTLVVTDDGLGFGKLAVNHRGLGLRSMQHRAKALRGSVTLERGARGGTVVTCRVPLGDGARGGAGDGRRPG